MKSGQITANLMQFFDYFNVTSQYMVDTDHQWDYDNTPETTAEDGGRDC